MKYINIENLEKIQQQLFITKGRESKNGFTWTVASKLGDTLYCAEQYFGERDKTYTILGIEFILRGNPQVWYPENCGNIVIQLKQVSITPIF